MATVSGACVISKVSGLLQIHEDTMPSKLIWKAIDQDKSLEIPLNKLSKLQASPETSPKMLLRLFYQLPDSPEIKDLRLTFNNRQTMTAVKETLQTIVARQKTVIKDKTPAASAGDSAGGTPQASQKPNEGSPAPGDPLDFSSPQSLSDASLLKNRHLQQKLLLEDKTLRNIFTQSVINFQLSPAIFWSTRVGQLRTYALSICQHRGPYNVLSTIKPVATSDNQVNVNVTRDTINEIFETYPIIRRACHELVPEKLNEGEFWSRFFNSKLFRRLRGDKINNTNSRGDMIIDKYLYVDADFVEKEDQEGKGETIPAGDKKVNKFIDLLGNEVDNSQKLGISPDFTMKFSDETANKNLPGQNFRLGPSPGKRENEMLVLMRNMNKLSSKMIGYSDSASAEDPAPEDLIQEMEREVEINDLNEASDIQYIELNLDTHISKHRVTPDRLSHPDAHPNAQEVSSHEVENYLQNSVFGISAGAIDLSDTYEAKAGEIAKAHHDISTLVKHNFRVYKSAYNYNDPNLPDLSPLLPDEKVQEIISFNITLTEFLSHFWNLFTNRGNPVQLKKLFTALRNSQTSLVELETELKGVIENNDLVMGNEKIAEKLLKDLTTVFFPLTSSVSKAITDYVAAVRAAATEASNEVEEGGINENGKRPHGN